MTATPILGETPLVPIPISDRYPLHYGASTTVSTITGALRLAELGYRLQYVDLLAELIEGDPQARNAVSTRVKAVAGRPWSITPAETAPGDTAGEHIAQVVADYVTRAIKRIPKWKSHVAGLLWALVYGVGAREVMWRRMRDGEFRVTGLRLVHTRRLGYDWNWDLVWSDYGQSNTGTPLRKFPGKFLVFEPSLSDEYPTREGLGRTLAYWLGFKRFGVRDFMAFVERFGKPYPDVEWKTGEDNTADEEAIQTAKKLAKDIGRGSLAGVAHPDTIKVTVSGSGSTSAGSGASGENTPHKALIQLVDEQVSKLILAQAYTTNAEQGTGGLGGGSDVFADASQLMFVDDCGQIQEAIDTDLIWWIVCLNFGQDIADEYCPHYSIEIEDPEDADKVMERISTAVMVGFPMPVEFVADRMQWPTPEPGDDILTSGGATGTYLDPEEREAERLAMQEALAGQAENDNADEQDKDDDKGTAPKAKTSKRPKSPKSGRKAPGKRQRSFADIAAEARKILNMTAPVEGAGDIA